jgi:oligopeptide/dipeptide ABC transporter ATP-binding protein
MKQPGTGGPGGAGTSRESVVIDVRNLTVEFNDGGKTAAAVQDVSFTLHAGEILGIVGESGSGKSTTALALGRLTPPGAKVSGEVRVLGHDIWTVPRRELPRLFGGDVAYVFQDPLTTFNPLAKVGNQLTYGLRTHRGLSRRDAMKLACDRLQEVHLASPKAQLNRYPDEFSGGMRQRLAIAGALTTEPRVLIADEPTTALDVGVQAQIVRLLRELRDQRDMAIIFISHDLGLISQICDRVLVMYAGRIVEDLSVAQLRTDPRHPYTRDLIGCLPESVAERGQRLLTIRGEPPSLTELPAGCPFHPRCPAAFARCLVERPELRSGEATPGHRSACHLGDPAVADPTAAGTVPDA